MPRDHHHAINAQGAPVTDDRLDWHLENWAFWQRAPDNISRGYPGAASSGIGVSRRSHLDSMIDAADARCARVVDSIVGELSPVQRAAVNHYHLDAVFRFPRVGMGAERAYARARETIAYHLTRRGIE